MTWPPAFFSSGTRKRPDWDTYFLGIAEAVAQRADCTRRLVGAVIVDSDHRIVSTGYNGAPVHAPGCLSSGACPRGLHYPIIVDGSINPLHAERYRCACGNSWPCPDSAPPGGSYDTGAGSCVAVHAEANALLYGDWARYRGSVIYITDAPCDGCKRLIAGAGITRTVYAGGAAHP